METTFSDQTQLRQQHRRFISYNVGIWVVILVFGVLILGLTRQYGNSLTIRHQAGINLQEGAALVSAGNSFQAERAWLRALVTWPGIVNTLVDTHYRDIVSMPLIHDALLEIRDEQPEIMSGLTNLRLQLILNTENLKPLAILDEYAFDRESRRIAAMWLGRLALDQGDLSGAYELFDIAWYRDASRRQAQSMEILDAYADAPETLIFLLLHNGLWTVALENASVLESTSKPTAETHALQGLLCEIDNDLETARQSYDKALKLLPNHWRANQGIQRLN